MSGPRLKVEYQNQTKITVEQNAIIDHLSTTLRALKQVGTVEFELIIVGDETIKQLNKQHRGENKPTDVLSFEASDDTRHATPSFIGSVVISADQALNQAKQAKIPLVSELKLLSTHGLLHLLGYNHR